MGKSSKNKKSKVPKLTEAEFAAYVAALKEGEALSPPEEKREEETGSSLSSHTVV